MSDENGQARPEQASPERVWQERALDLQGQLQGWQERARVAENNELELYRRYVPVMDATIAQQGAEIMALRERLGEDEPGFGQGLPLAEPVPTAPGQEGGE